MNLYIIVLSDNKWQDDGCQIAVSLACGWHADWNVATRSWRLGMCQLPRDAHGQIEKRTSLFTTRVAGSWEDLLIGLYISVAQVFVAINQRNEQFILLVLTHVLDHKKKRKVLIYRLANPWSTQMLGPRNLKFFALWYSRGILFYFPREIRKIAKKSKSIRLKVKKGTFR